MNDHSTAELADTILRVTLATLAMHGWKPEEYSDGEGDPQDVDGIEDVLCCIEGVDMSWIEFGHEESQRHFTLLVIPGNGPDVIADFSAPADIFDEVDRVMNLAFDASEALIGD